MARALNGTNQYCSRSAFLSGFPFSIGAWLKASNTTADRGCINLYQSGASNYISVGLLGAQTGDPAAIDFYPNSGSGRAASSSGYSANTWHHVLAVATSASSWKIYLDGSNSGTSAASYTGTFASINTFSLGRLDAFGSSYYGESSQADIGVWNVALTADEAAGLANGRLSADQVRPDALVAYYPLGGLRPDNDKDQWGKAYDLTATNSPTSVDGPRLWYPDDVDVVTSASAATKYWLWANRNAAMIG